MVKNASVSAEALHLIGQLLYKGKKELKESIHQFTGFLQSKRETGYSEENLQNQFTVLKLRYNQILDQLDIYADVLSQRCEHEVGIWLAGLDVLAEDGLKAGKAFYEAPALMVFVERGHGAAIRRARTRLPGGDENPVAVIQIPRERMVGNGIASSLIHEVGHQGAALLDLIPSLKSSIHIARSNAAKNKGAYTYYDRCISEIIADFWAMAHLGVSATMGLMGVVTLPSYFQFRLDMDDPHPAPYIRVQLSCRIGKKLFPDPQWDKLWSLWESFYPKAKVPKEKLIILQSLDAEMDRFIDTIIQLKPPILKGKRLLELFNIEGRQPQILREKYTAWKTNPGFINQEEPIMVFAVLGQAKMDHRITAQEENHLLTQQLNRWANHR